MATSAWSRRASSGDLSRIPRGDVRAAARDEERANALVHVVGLAGAGLGAGLLASLSRSPLQGLASAALCGPMIALFAASVLHHGLTGAGVKRLFLAFDHGAVLLLIAGSYTAFALLALVGAARWWLLAGVWSAAGAGLLLGVACFAIHRERLFERLSPPFDLLLGWLPLLAFGSGFAAALPTPALALVVAGGVAYSAGAAIYLSRRRWSHAVWHAAVVVGCALHVGAVALLLR
jgi:hemolysin III